MLSQAELLSIEVNSAFSIWDETLYFMWNSTRLKNFAVRLLLFFFKGKSPCVAFRMLFQAELLSILVYKHVRR